MSSADSAPYKVGFPIGAVFFGSLVGPSMISGIYSKVYLVPYGAWAFIFALTFPLISGTIIGFSAELVRRNKVYDYNSFCHVLYGKYSLVCTPLMEIYMLMAQVLTLGAVVSMGGTFMNQIAGWPPILGSLFLAAICLLLVLWGAHIVRRSATVMCIILVIGFAFLSIYSAAVRWDALSQIMTTWYVPAEADMAHGVYMAIMFGFSGACNGMVLAALMQKVETRKHAISTGLWSFLLTTIVLVLEVLVILPYIPEVLLSDVPTMWIIQNYLAVNLPWLPALYFSVMFFALITSGVPANQAMIARVSKVIPRKGIFSNEIVLRAFIGLAFLGLVLLIASLGLTTIVSKGYSSLGFIGIPLIFIPTCILMPIRWRRERLAAKETFQ